MTRLLALAAAAFLAAALPAAAQEPEAPRTLRIVAAPDAVRPGDPFAVAAAERAAADGPGAAPARATLVSDDGTPLAAAILFPYPIDMTPETAVFAAILAVPSTARSGGAALRILGVDGSVVAERQVAIGSRDFVREEIPLDADNTALRTVPDPRKTAEAEALWKLLARTDPQAVFAAGTFVPPVASTRRTSRFGDRRIYRYADGKTETAIHAGIDYGVPRGTPVAASGAGRVVFAAERIVTGRSVVIEHLPGVYSLYYHLDRIDVAAGDLVAAGKSIGRSGSTGLSTGPHLHWEFRVAGENADPDVFLSRPILDKEAIIGKIRGSIGAPVASE
jgi:murein DD-endopeptidase MepM/ murein hydrolase activator NlpD